MIDMIHTSHTGRYVESEIPIEVTVFGLSGMEHGSCLSISLLNESGENLYKHDVTLNSGDNAYIHIIPKNVFVGLKIGEYIIEAVYDGNATRTAYSVVARPTVAFLEISPSNVTVPLHDSIDIIAVWVISGKGMSGISGTSEIHTLGLRTNINRLGGDSLCQMEL